LKSFLDGAREAAPAEACGRPPGVVFGFWIVEMSAAALAVAPSLSVAERETLSDREGRSAGSVHAFQQPFIPIDQSRPLWPRP
jgi:hypothetical protein